MDEVITEPHSWIEKATRSEHERIKPPCSRISQNWACMQEHVTPRKTKLPDQMMIGDACAKETGSG